MMTTNTIAAGRMPLATDHQADCSLRGWIGTILVRVVVPLWLLAGAGFKLFALDPRLLPKPVFDSVQWLSNAINADFGPFLMFSYRSMVAVELILVGIMIFVPRYARAAAIAILSIFCIVLLAEMWGALNGRGFEKKGWRVLLEPCGCFGSNSPPSILTFAIDAGLLLGVLFCRPGPEGRRLPRWPITGIAAIASLVVGSGLAFGRPDRVIALPTDQAEYAADASSQPGGNPPPAPDQRSAQPATATPPDSGRTTAPAASATPWPPAPAKLSPTYFINEKKAIGQRLDSLPLALVITRPMPETINSGRWHLIFYRKDCDHCFEIMNKHFSGKLPAPTLAIEIPDAKGKPFPMPCKECQKFTLPKGPDYVVGSPLLMTIVDGVIVGISKDVDKPGVIEAVLQAGLPGTKQVDGSFLVETPAAGAAAAPSEATNAATAPQATATARPFPPVPQKLESYYAPEFEKWKGRRLDEQVFATLIKRPIPVDLNQGTVCIVFYRADCDHCQQLFADHFAGALKVPTLAVAIPDTDPALALDMPCRECSLLSLIEGPTYVVETPVLIVVKDGVVQCAIAGQATEDPTQVEACLPK